jgi:hypothetical protein
MSPSGGLHHGQDFPLSEINNRCQVKRTETVKSDTEAIKSLNFLVWCEHCSIRIAPNEERVAVKNKTYHQRCYAKSKAIAGAEK